MSQITNRITTVFSASAPGVLAMMGGVAGGFTNIQRSAYNSQRSLVTWDSQMKAIGTTIRYAFAGTLIFGLTRTVGQLAEIQRQVGLISVTGTTGGLKLTGQSLRGFMDETRIGSVDALTPITEYNNAIVNLLSTVRSIPQDEITPVVTRISQAAQISQVAAEEATKAFASMNQAFGVPVNLQAITKTAAQFIEMIQRVPGGATAGPQIIGQLGQLAAASRFARISQPEMFGLLAGPLRFGITPSMSGRGLAFLLQTLANPEIQTAESRRAFRRARVTTKFVQEEGGIAALGRIFDTARRLGGLPTSRQGLRSLSRKLSTLEMQIGEEGELPADLGIGGKGIKFLGQTFRRIHALRTAIALMGDPELSRDISDFTRFQQDYAAALKSHTDKWRTYQVQQPLREAGIALQNLRLQLGQSLAPLLNIVATGGTRTQQFLAKHPRETELGTLAGAGLLAALGIGKFMGRRMGGILGRFGGRGIQSALFAKAAEDAMINAGGGPGLSPQNPIYVVVVGQLFGGAPGKGVPPIAPVPITGGKTAKARLGPGRVGVGVLGGLTVAAYLAQYFGFDAWGLLGPSSIDEMNQRIKALRDKKLGQALPNLAGAAGRLFGPGDVSKAEKDILNKVIFGKLPFEQGERTLREMRQQEHRLKTILESQKYILQSPLEQLIGQGTFKVTAKGEVVIDVKALSETGKATKQRVHLPADVEYSGGRVPSSRGQSGKTRRATLPSRTVR